MSAAGIILLIAAFYTASGAFFATAFTLFGVGRVDHAAADGPWTFRAIIWPGCAALWPVMMAKWIGVARGDHGRPGPMHPSPLHTRDAA